MLFMTANYAINRSMQLSGVTQFVTISIVFSAIVIDLEYWFNYNQINNYTKITSL